MDKDRKMKVLKSCPFCGSNLSRLLRTTDLRSMKTVFYVKCLNCGVETAYRAKKISAISLWQKRINHKDNEIENVE
jgi:Lar family restriction alleviation protein